MQGHSLLANNKSSQHQPNTSSKQLANKKKLYVNDKENSSQQENASKAKQNKSNEKQQNVTTKGRQQNESSDQQQFLALRKQAFTYQPQVIDQQNESTIYNNYVHVSNSSSFTGGMQQHFQPIVSINNENNGGLMSSTQIFNSDTIDSSEIKGRRIDSPQLLVVREIKELDEEDDIQDEQIRQFGTGSDDLANLLWNSRDLRQQHFTNESPRKIQQRKQHTKSVDNKHKLKNNNSQAKTKIFNRDHHGANNNYHHHNLQNQGTKSQREIRSSMGFNELLNNLDKDISLNQNSNLIDFKNRTTYDLLKLELSGIRRQNSQTKNRANKLTRSKSREAKKPNNKDKDKDNQDPSLRNYNDILPLSQHQQAVDRTKSQSTLGGSGSIPAFQQIANRSKNYPPSSAQNQIKLGKEQLQGSPQKKDYKAIGSIDKLIKNNIKRMKEKENGVKLLKQKSEDMLKKKKVDLDQKNSQVRKINQERTLRRKNQFQVLNPTKEPHMQYYQQIRDIVPKRFKSEQIQFVNQQQHHMQQPHKQSQTQKIDFDEIKEEIRNRENKKISLKNHRKSYGLEFFEIKKEIEQEMRTIDQKMKSNNSLLLKPKQKLNIANNNNNISTTEQSIQRIKVKLQNRPAIIDITEKKGSTERTPVSKVVTIIKKDKIRRFMKAKQKELITIAMHQKREEISRFIKMQQNMHKLNDFCKKKLDKTSHSHKQQHQNYKKRNTTMQVLDQHHEGEHDKKEFSKISIKTHKNTTSKKTDSHSHLHQFHGSNNQQFFHDNSNINIMGGNNNNLHDSSKISTEFYEEYFRLLNSISKEQKENISQMGIFQQQDIANGDQSSSNKTKRKLLKSPTAVNRSLSPPSKMKANSPQKTNQNKQILTKVATKKSKSKNNLKQSHQQQQQQTLHNKIVIRPPLDLRKHFKDYPSTSVQEAKNSRAESAPLFHQQSSSLKKRLNGSNHKQSQKGLLATGGANEGRATSNNQNQNQNQHQNQRSTRDPLSNSDRLHVLLYHIVVIQRAMRNYLNEKGFYSRGHQQQQQYQQDYQSSSFYNNADTTVVMQQIVESIDKLNSIDVDETDNNMSESDDNNNNQMLIINQQNQGQEKKVIYMSNINSCSAPQSPKDDSQKMTLLNQQDIIKQVFNYNPHHINNDNDDNDSQQLQSSSGQQSSLDEAIHQEVSQKPSIRTIEIEIDNKIDMVVNAEEFKEIKSSNVDYNMRMFTGSQSMLKELKHNTPKHTGSSGNHHLQSQDLFLLSQHSQGASKKNNNGIQFSVDSRQSHIDHTSQSSQSLFDRNSFQQFTMHKLNQIEHNNEFANLISVREKALEYRQQKETKFMRKLYNKKQLSPRTYDMKKEQLEKWVRVEQEEIKKTKIAFNEEWKKTVQMIEDTQKNVEQMREKMKIDIGDNNNHHHNHLGHGQGLFNSQSSRNSSSSYVASAKRRSLLEEEPRLSQRSYMQHQQLSTQSKDYQQQQQQQLDKQDQLSKPSHNLIDYLESKWQSQKQDDEDSKIKSRQSRQGIYIEDQNEKIQSSEVSDNDNDQFFQQQLDKMNGGGGVTNTENNENIEKTLQRSRSEQDLSELIKKSKLESYMESEEAVDDHNLLETQQIESMSQTLKDLTVRKAEIQIEENQFVSQEEDDDNDQEGGSGNQQPEKYEKYQDLQSNDSILNESDLNMYFQEQQFSLEDFKSLDKRKMMLEQQQQEQQNMQEELGQDREVATQRQLLVVGNNNNQDVADVLTENSRDNIRGYDTTNNDDVSRAIIQTEPNDPQQYFDPKIDLIEHTRTYTPDIVEQNSMFQQQYLFSGAKPGQNIKIADILKKSQSLTSAAESMNSYNNMGGGGADQNSQMMFQNHQINQQFTMLSPTTASAPPAAAVEQYDPNSVLADQLTDEILKYLLQQSLVLPHRLLNDDDQLDQVVAPQSAQDQNQDVFIIDSLINEREQKKELIEYKQRSLIEQDLQKAEIYINEVISVLLQSEIAALENEGQPGDFQNFHKQFLTTLTAPIKRNEIEILNQLQTAEIGSYEHFETVIQPNQYPILPVELYLEIERQREEQQLQQIMKGESSPVDIGNSVLQESTHIHNKAVFDALNESLIKFRPYGLQGEPMPWSNRNRRLQTKVDAGSVDTERLFLMVKQDVLRWIQTYSGCQASSIFVFQRQNNIMQNNQIIVQTPISEQDMFDEELFQETRERRLAATLANEVVESEHLWFNYEFEDNQVKIDLSDMILEHLVEEAVMVLNSKIMGSERQELTVAEFFNQ